MEATLLLINPSFTIFCIYLPLLSLIKVQPQFSYFLIKWEPCYFFISCFFPLDYYITLYLIMKLVPFIFSVSAIVPYLYSHLKFKKVEASCEKKIHLTLDFLGIIYLTQYDFFHLYTFILEDHYFIFLYSLLSYLGHVFIF